MTRAQTVMTTSLALAATVVYVVMWVGYAQDWGWLHSLDWSLLNAAHDLGAKHPAWVSLWNGVSFLLVPLRLLGLVVAPIALVKRQVRIALLLLVCLPLSGFVTMVAKNLADRPRPVTALVIAHSTSFPSGHSLEMVAGVLALLTVLLPMTNSRSRRYAAVMVGALMVVLVGISRVALNVHHPTDVVAGWALGYLYFLACLWVFRPPPIFDARRIAAGRSPPAAMSGQVPTEAGQARSSAATMARRSDPTGAAGNHCLSPRGDPTGSGS